MSYRHIENLYRNKTILLFKQAYAMEKIHGSSAHLKYIPKPEFNVDDRLIFFSGGAKHEQFLKIFNQEELLYKFRENAKDHPDSDITIYGEVYGGSMQGMSNTYGPDLRFIAFEVKINDVWLCVPQAEKFVQQFNLEFVPYEIIDTTEEAINAIMMKDSEIAIRRGMGTGKMREGVVLRPMQEFVHQGENGGPIRVKHKRPEFEERARAPKFADPEKLKLIEDANEAANEFVVPMRLQHILDKFPEPKMEDANKIIKAMLEDVYREASGEVVESKELRKAIGKKTMQLFKKYLENNTFNKGE